MTTQEKKYKFPGRPRVWNPEELSLQLDEWSKKEDSRWLGDFLIEIECGNHTHLSRWATESEDFATSLRLAKLRIASRIRGQLHDERYNASLFHREIGMYDLMLKEHDREEKVFEASLKRSDDQPYTPEQAKALKSVLDAVSKYQNAPANTTPTSPATPSDTKAPS